MTDRLDRVLIAVDESSASMDAVAYVGHVLGGRKHLFIRLFHVLPPIPPSLREFGGSEDPRQEAQLSAELRHAQDRWTDEARQSAKGAMDKAVTLLIEQGLSAQQLSTEFCPPLRDRDDLVQQILDVAQDWDCGTIVVGRRTLPWLEALFARHVGEELVRRAEHCAVWVVE